MIGDTWYRTPTQLVRKGLAPVGVEGSSSQDFDIIIGFIQSNIRGAATDFSPALDAAASNVYEWDWATNSIVPAALPGSNQDGFPGMGVMTSFVNDYAADHPDRKVLKINVARGGTGFTTPSTNTSNGTSYTGLHWRHDLANNQNNLAHVAVSQVQTIMATVGSESKIVAMLANHGSTDGSNNTPKAMFKGYLQDWITWMRSQLSVAEVPYLMMQMRPNLVENENRHKIIDDAQVETAAEMSHVGYVLSPSDPSNYKADVVHFNAKGVREIGHRLYAKFTESAPVPASGYGARPSVIPAPIVGRPSGPGYQPYEDLYRPGDTITQALERCDDNVIVTFPEGEFTFSGFDQAGTTGILIPKRCNGIIGSGKGTLGGSRGTIFKMLPNTSTYVAPTQGSSQPTLASMMMRIGGVRGGTFANFQLVGTEQIVGGRTHPYHGFSEYNPGGVSTLQDILIAGWYGDNGAPPGETFGITLHGKSGGPQLHGHRMIRVETDGRRVLGGPSLGAVGITHQNTVGGYMIDCNMHHTRYASYVAYQVFNLDTFDCTFDQSGGERAAWCINHERTNGINHYRPKMLLRSDSTNVHISHSNDHWSANYDGVTRNVIRGQMALIGPEWTPIWSQNRPFVETWKPYSIGGMEVVGPNGEADSMDVNHPPIVVEDNGVTPIQYKWNYGSGPHKTIPAVMPNPYKPTVALIGDSTLEQDGSGDTNIRSLLEPKFSTISFYAKGGKAISYADANGYTTLQNMTQARVTMGDRDPDVWIFNLGANGHHDGDTNNVKWINAVMNNTRRSVIWIGLSQANNYNGGASSEATRLHWNSIAKAAVEAHPHGMWADWHAHIKARPGGDADLWNTDGVHMPQKGYAFKNTFIMNQLIGATL